jgi:hypothetical protein
MRRTRRIRRLNLEAYRMDVLTELFTTFIGLLSLSVIVFIIAMGVFFVVWFMKLSKPPVDADAKGGAGRREGSSGG